MNAIVTILPQKHFFTTKEVPIIILHNLTEKLFVIENMLEYLLKILYETYLQNVFLFSLPYQQPN